MAPPAISKSRTARFLWDFTREGMALVSDAGYIKHANPAFCATLGYTDYDLIGKHISEITNSKDQKTDAIKFDQLVTGEIRSYSMNKKWRTKFGRAVVGELFARKWVDDILIYTSNIPGHTDMHPTTSSVMAEAEREQYLDQMIGKFFRSIPKKLLNSKKFWIILSLFGLSAGAVSKIIELIP
jgi:PAS domain S-box-containing protein